MIFLSKRASIKSFLSKARVSGTVEHYLLSFLIAFLLHVGRMTASQASQSLRFSRRHRANAARFLASVGWSNNWYACYRDAVLLLEAEFHRAGRWVFILDQTCCSHQGPTSENTYSTGNRLRRPRQGRRYGTKRYMPREVHAFVMGLLLTPSGLRLPVNKCYFTKTYAARHGLVYQTQADLGATLIDELAVPAGAKVMVLGDTAYDAKQVRAACDRRKFHWLVPCNTERVRAGKTKKERVKVRSLMQSRQPEQFTPIKLSPNQGKHTPLRRVSSSRRKLKQTGRTFYVHAEQMQVKSVGTVLLLASGKDKPLTGNKPKLTKVLMTNDLTLTPREGVELYGLRWQIEILFKELKSHLGMHQYRFRDFRKVAAWVDLTLLSFLYLEWLRGKKLRDARLTQKEHDWWRDQRTHGLLQAVMHELQVQEQAELTRLASTKTGVKQLRKLLRQAAPPQRLFAA